MIGKLFGNLFGRTAAPSSAPHAQGASAGPDPTVILLAEIKLQLFSQGTLLSSMLMRNLLSEPQYRDPKRLERHGWKGYSQNDEDGILDEIFRRIGAPHRTFVEFGVGSGVENNTIYLLSQGWRGLWMDGDAGNIANANTAYGYLIEHGLLQCRQTMVTAENIDALVSAADLGAEIDLLSVDIDGNDAHVWRALRSTSARVVVVEYNAKFHPSHDFGLTYNPQHQWDQTDRMGASLAVLTALGDTLGYRLVGCNITGNNAFFVRGDLAGDLFAAPASAAHLYQEPRYYLTPYFSSGHRVNTLTVVESAAAKAGLPWPPTRPLDHLLGPRTL